MVNGLDQDPAGMGIACLVNVTKPPGLYGCVLSRNPSQKSHELARLITSLHVAKLSDENGGRGEFEPTQTRQGLDGGEKPPAGRLHLDECLEPADPLECLGYA